MERLDQPLAVELPLMREIRAVMSRALENGRDPAKKPFPDVETYQALTDAPALYSGSFGMGSRDLQPEGLIAAVENMLLAITALASLLWILRMVSRVKRSDVSADR